MSSEKERVIIDDADDHEELPYSNDVNAPLTSTLIPKKKSFLTTLSILAMLVLTAVVIYIYLLPKWPTFSNNFVEHPHRVKFKEYLKQYNKTYEGEEFERRYNIYKQTCEEIEDMNEKVDDPVHYGTNKFSDMTQEEFEQKMLMMNSPFDGCSNAESTCNASSQIRIDDFNIKNDSMPSKFDWRDKGVIGPVLDQNLCLSCWAFSIVGVMESMALITNLMKKYVRLSIQELTDCPDGYTYQCGGGNPELALLYLCNGHLPITTEKRYPLTLVNQTCEYSDHKPSRKPPGIIINDFVVKCDMTGEEIARQVYSHGPVVATVNSIPWKNYNGGIISYHCTGDTMNQLNHVVQIVGYDLEDPVPHFIVRNSWGVDFGDQGYLKIAMDGFVCGIGRQISYFNVGKVGSL